jgi:outer membrane protein
MKILKIIFFFFFGFIFPQANWSQTKEIPLSLSLENVVYLAKTQSSSVKYAQNSNVNSFWRWRNFETRFRPQLTLRGDLPSYTHSTTPITQPDGSIEFKQVSNAQVSSSISLSQSIPQLGTSVYAATSIYRIQDFNNNSVDFSGSPFSVGFTQPIFGYNGMKWSKKTEPLIYNEANRNYIESIEEIALNATIKFFKYLRVQTNFNLAESNLKNSEVNLIIAETKRKLGTISENDYSRIQLSVLNARKSLNSARMDLRNADFELKSYIGLDQEKDISLIIPLNVIFFDIDPQKALSEAQSNRKEALFYERRLISAERDVEQAKRNSGLSAQLKGSYGISNSAEEFPEIYKNPETQRVFKLTVTVPILDWGRSASEVKLAESERDLVVFDVEKDQQDFERSVIVQVEQFGLLKDQMATALEADKVAENGYKIALKKFQNGEISITDLNIALSERDKAKRDYITSLEDYWRAYYNLRILTLYDFENDCKLIYNNPMLEN